MIPLLLKSKIEWRHWVGFVAFGLLLFCAGCFAAVWQFVIPVYIPLYAYLLYALGCSLLLLPFMRMGSLRRIKFTLHAIFLLSMVLMWFFPLSSRQPFLKDLAAVQSGMTAIQVDAIMGQYIKGTGWPATPYDRREVAPGTLTEVGSGATYQTKTNNGALEIAGARTYRHSNAGAYNSDWGVVSFKDGRVVKVEFMPD